ncbi:LacI family DNA-binding transcriptional regulator [Kordiimonas sp.]|uniref:LacI family DNA-binding transcriptional regulator n=1 Tax=Kordiimonas sp. TaxID=1970157 RepID=UPI003A94F68D
MATIRDVAAEAGVSRATVTRVLHEPDKVSPAKLAKVQAAIKKLGYRPNMLSQTFRSSSARTIVVLAPNLANPFFAQVIAGIVDASDELGYKILVGSTNNSTKREADYIKMVETRLADGIIQMAPFTEGGVSLLPREHVPAVSVAGVPGTPYPGVRIDNVAAVKECIQYLASLGHMHIGAITGPASNSNTIVRLKGFREGLYEAGLPYLPELVREGDFRLVSGFSAMADFMLDSNPIRPTAIFCMNDEMALGAMRSLKTFNLRVPDDISIIGFDNLDFSAFASPALTTVEQPAYDMGRRSAALLVDMLEGRVGKADADIVLPYRFVERESTAVVHTRA